MLVRHVCPDDAQAIIDIYNHYIINTQATFETETVSCTEMILRFNKVKAANLPWLVLEDDDKHILGYAYATQWRQRFAYRFSTEITVYLNPMNTRQGLGSRLYAHLFSLLKEAGIHSVIAGITLPNEASIKLHEKFAMEKVAHFKQVGYKFDQWLDVGYWQGQLTH
jgi:phosphinothricin acetyltransferase